MFKMELVTRNSDGLKNFYDDDGRILFKKWLSYVSEPDSAGRGQALEYHS